MKLKHMGVILDGNRRWAKEKGLNVMEGHFESYKNFTELSKYIFQVKKVPYLTAYVFSTENWRRTEEEVSFLMGLVVRALKDNIKTFIDDDIKILVLGSRDKLRSPVIKAIEEAEHKTMNNKSGTLSLCFNYGGQAELVDATRKIINKGIGTHDITEATIYENIYHPEVPPLDLIIRSSGEQRLSGFMLWRAAYSELLFVPKYWPDFTSSDIDDALEEYSRRQRRYGK